MYVKCNKLDVARQIFDRMDVKDIVSWGAMISGYVQNHDNVSALQLFERMQAETESIRPNKVVFSSVLRACACLRYIKHARLVHHFVVRSGWESDKVVGSALIDVYAKCGVLKEAFNVFKKLQVKDVVSWNAIIIGYMQHGLGRTSLSLFARMMNSKVKPDRITFLGTLKACGMIGAVGQGKMIHHHIIRNTFESDITIGSALVDMYVKCGSLGEAHILSKNIPEKNIVSWGATIAGYAQQGDHVLVGKCLHEMARQGVNPNGAIYVNIFAACSHAGDVTKCLQYFNLMVNSHCIMPGTEHFNCMVDVLGRAGLLEEAKVLLQSMPIQADVTCWVSLLSSCQTYGELDLGRRCFNQLVEIDPEYASSYVLMYRMYADLNMWDYLSKIRGLRTSSCVWKNYDYKELR
jgi:pentatricopeptide repeat protein